MQIKRAARLERLAQPLIRFMGVFATRAKRRAEALWRSKTLKHAETLRDAKARTLSATRPRLRLWRAKRALCVQNSRT